MVAASDPQPTHDPGPAPGKSTGPRTKAGKARSRLNAVTHGLTATTPLLRGEDPGEFRQFVWDVVADLDPQGPVQAELAHRAAVLMWKRRRINGAERQVISELERRYFVEAGGDEEGGGDAEGTEEQAIEEGVEAAVEPEVCESDDPTRVARFLIADEFASKPDQLERLARYEQRISQQIDSTIRLLLKLQNRQDWQRGQRAAAEPPAGGRVEKAVIPARAHSATPPRAPAQNELPSEGPAKPKDAPPRPWADPPGTN